MLAFTIFFCESLTFSKFPIKIGTGSWAQPLNFGKKFQINKTVHLNQLFWIDFVLKE